MLISIQELSFQKNGFKNKTNLQQNSKAPEQLYQNSYSHLY